MMTRYRVGVGEKFPMAERPRREFERGAAFQVKGPDGQAVPYRIFL